MTPNDSRQGKGIELTPDVYEYIVSHRSNANDAVLDALREETERSLGGVSTMLVPREQGSFLTLLIKALGVRRPIEIGTFTGYSAICIARGLPEDGKLLCCDISEEWTDIARRHWQSCGLDSKIELRLGPAQSTLEALDPEETFDFAFIDADKSGYDAYYELVLPRLKPSSVILFDNMLQRGKVAEQNPEGDAAALNALNTKLANDPRIEAVLVPLADGIMMCRKK
ncbi:MAG: caffeoyl-CoA O-methyltransferase [Abditibacteriota bacterium]|nr:caffeoyl-CoA O-methyltransferase [Abditibacteriota bacterium]